jgi:Flp pilus assembly protein TadG
MRMRKIPSNESGQVMVLTLISMTVLFGFLALAFDVGLLFRAKRNMQIAADAASTAGALDYYKENSNAYAINAGQSAIANTGLSSASFGCPAAASGNTPGVCVRSPATTGSHTGNGFVEVEVVQPNQTTLMSLFGFSTINVGARSVAGLTNSQSCIFVKGTLNVQGNASLCGAAAGSTITNGFCGSGSTCGTAAPAACGVYAGNITGSGGGGGSNCIDSQFVETSASSSGVNLNPSPAATSVPAQTPPAWVANFNPTKANPCNMPAGGTWSSQGSGNNKVNVYTVTLSGSLSTGC